MKTFHIFPLMAVFAVLLFSSGCKEAKQGVDDFSGEVTGKNKIEKKLEVEDKIKNLTDQATKKQEEALKKVGE